MDGKTPCRMYFVIAKMFEKGSSKAMVVCERGIASKEDGAKVVIFFKTTMLLHHFFMNSC